MRLSFEYNEHKITYNVMYKKRSSIAITVEANGEVNVLAPLGTSVRTIMDKVKGHGAFIVYELTKQQALGKGEIAQCMYLGKNYGVETIKNEEATQASVKLVRGKFVVEANQITNEIVRDALSLWYSNKAKAKAKERMKVFKEHFEKVPKNIKVDILSSTLWEVEKDNITLDVNTIVGPVCVFDAIFVQALCAFNQVEDSRAKLLETVEQCEQAQNWLNENKDKFLF